MSRHINLHYTDHRGRPQIMDADEVQAISRSGTCSLRLYIRGEAMKFDRPVIEETENGAPVMDVLSHADERPAKTKQGPPRIEDRKTSGWSKNMPKGLWHLRIATNGHHPVCGGKAILTDVFGYKRFARLSTHANACPKCVDAWRKEKEDPNGRKPPKFCVEDMIETA